MNGKSIKKFAHITGIVSTAVGVVLTTVVKMLDELAKARLKYKG